MDRKNQKVLTLYRNHILSRLEYAYADGRIDQEQYRQLHQEVSQSRSFGGLRAGLTHLRSAAARRNRAGRWRVARRQVNRQEARVRRQRRWWRPERFWVLGVAIALVIGVLALVGLRALTNWLSTM